MSHYDLRNSALVLFEVTANYSFSQYHLQTLILKTPASAKLAVKYGQGRWNTCHQTTSDICRRKVSASNIL